MVGLVLARTTAEESLLTKASPVAPQSSLSLGLALYPDLDLYVYLCCVCDPSNYIVKQVRFHETDRTTMHENYAK